MRTLQSTELQAVSGGTPADAACGVFILGAITLVTLAAIYGPTYPYVTYEPQYYEYDVASPVYDEYGYYQGDVVNTYQDVQYVPVYS